MSISKFGSVKMEYIKAFENKYNLRLPDDYTDFQSSIMVVS